MRGILFDQHEVEIDPRSVSLGGSWQGEWRNNMPTAWDGELLKFFHSHLIPGSHYLDIGANTGSYALLTAIVPATCVAFEPYPDVCSVLRANVALNQLESRVRVYQHALSNQIGKAWLQIPSGGKSGLACTADVPTRFTPVAQTPIYTKPLNTIDVGRVDLVKIDVEGAELQVLLGAEETLQEYHPKLLVEYDERNTPAFGYTPCEIVQYLTDLGYRNFEYLGPDRRDLWATA